MKIEYIITGLECGGAEKQLLDCAKIMKSKGHAVNIISIASNRTLLNFFIDEKIDVIFFDLTKKLNIIALIKYIRSSKPDIIHSHMIHSNIVACILKVFYKGCKLFCTSHNINEGDAIILYMRNILYKFVKPHVSHVSQLGLDSYSTFLPKKVLTDCYKNPIDLANFNPVDLNTKIRVWICVASFTRQKRHDRLLAAFSQLLNTYPDEQLVLVGDGPLFKDCKEISIKLGIDKQVKFMGLRDDIPQLLSQSFSFVMSSDWEGLPVSIIEAMAAGLPIVSTICGDIPSLVENHFNGFLSEDKTSESLCKRMIDLIESENYKQLSINSLSRSKSYSIENYYEFWIKRYENYPI